MNLEKSDIVPSVFDRIINREISAKIIFEDERVIAFHDNSPKAPVHLLVVPKKRIVSLLSAVASDQDLLGYLLLVSQKVAKDHGLSESGYRLVINNGESVGQSVFHLHFHVLGGREFQWPPG